MVHTDEFVDAEENTLDLTEIPQIPLPFRDDISKELKDLIRAILINQQNIISNCSFLYGRVQDLSNILQRIAKDLPNTDPVCPEDPPADLPSLYSVPEE